jgi:hypothetical protein
MKSNDDQSNDYTKYFQIRTAKFITLVLIIVFSIYHGYLNLYYGLLENIYKKPLISYLLFLRS